MRNKIKRIQLTRSQKPEARSGRGAFTLVELVVVMAIIAVLALLIIGAIIVVRRTATETTNRTNANIIRTALESYYSRNRVYCGAPGGVACGAQSFATLATDLRAEGMTVNLNRTESATDGGTVTALTTTSARLVPYTAGVGSTTQMPGSAVTLP